MENSTIIKSKLPYTHHYMIYGVKSEDGQGQDLIMSAEYINDYTELELVSTCEYCGRRTTTVVQHDGSYARPQPEGDNE